MQNVVFVDTNILLYAASDGRLDPGKTDLSRQVLRERVWVLSMQVVQEFHVNATRKVALGISSDHAARVLDGLLTRVSALTTPDMFVRAVVLQNRFMLSYWDAAVLQSATEAG